MNTLIKSHRFAGELQIMYGYHFLSPFPGTELMENMNQYDLELLTKDWSRFDANSAIVQTSSMKSEDIEAFHENYYLKEIRKIEQDIEKRFQQNLLDETERQSYWRRKNLDIVSTQLSEDVMESIGPIPISDETPEHQLSRILSDEIHKPLEFISPCIEKLLSAGSRSYEITHKCAE